MESVMGPWGGRVALVTGAARGVGHAIARRLCDLGASVALDDLPRADPARAARELGESRLGRPAEVADLVCFLASESAAYITGSAYDIAGGDRMA